MRSPSRRPKLPLRFQHLEDRITPSTGWDKPHVADELIVQLRSTQPMLSLAGLVRSRGIEGVDVQQSRTLIRDTYSETVHVKLLPGVNAEEAANWLDSLPGVNWVNPNLIHKVATELTPNDPYYNGNMP